MTDGAQRLWPCVGGDHDPSTSSSQRKFRFTGSDHGPAIRVVLTEGWLAGGGGLEILPEMVEPPEAMAQAAVLLAGQDASGITGTIQRSEELASQS